MNYRAQIADVFDQATLFHDYEVDFPKNFTTYDALHPTWFGARLHALDILQKISQLDKFRLPSSGQIEDAYLISDESISKSVKDNLDGYYPPASKGFRRFDFFEPENARNLLQRLTAMIPGSAQESRILIDLSFRIRYWQYSKFEKSETTCKTRDNELCTAFLAEVGRAKLRTDYFKERLIELQSARLSMFPIPDLERETELQTEKMHLSPANSLNVKRFILNGDLRVVKVTDDKDWLVAIIVNDAVDGTEYKRVDILGDGSLLLLQIGSGPLLIPKWVSEDEPFKRFGI